MNDKDQILAMLDSLEEAIGQDIVSETKLRAAPDASAHVVELVPPEPEAAQEEPTFVVEAEALPPIAAVAPAGPPLQTALRAYPDAPPRPQAWIERVPGSTQNVLGNFRWET